MTGVPSAVADLVMDLDHVLDVSALRACMTQGAIRWQVESGRWQQPCEGVVVAHPGPPDRQHRRKDSCGRMRYLDADWERAKLVAEIDGAQHMDARQHWDDMSRDNDLIVNGYRVLRFPAWLVRYQPEAVARKIREALGQARGGAGDATG